MSAPDLVNSANPLPCTLDHSTIRKTAKTLNFELQQMEAPKQIHKPTTLLVSAVTAKSPNTGRKAVAGFRAAGTFSPLTSLSSALPIPNVRTARNYRGFSQSFPLIGSEKPLSRLGTECLCFYGH